MNTIRCFNDCVYGIIGIPPCARSVIATGLMQRLRRIKQLGNMLAWPSATHTRFEHSVGTMHLADEYAKQLDFTPREREVFVLAALLHDVGHGPYSHTFEMAIADTPSAKLFKNHDDFRIRLVVEDPELGEVVAPWVDDIVAVWTDDPTRAALSAPMVGIMHALLEGVAGVDRLDYVARDLYHTRPQMTLDRSCCQIIMGETVIDRTDGTVTYTSIGRRVISRFLEVRAYLYSEVYLHRRAVAASGMLHKALQAGGEPIVRPYLQSTILFESLDDGVIDALVNHPFIPPTTSILLRQLLRGDVPRFTPVTVAAAAEDGCNALHLCKKSTTNEMAHIVGIDQPADIHKWFTLPKPVAKTHTCVCRAYPPENIDTMHTLLTDAAAVAHPPLACPRQDLQPYLAVVAYDNSLPHLLRYRTCDALIGVLDGTTQVFQLTAASSIDIDTPPTLRRAATSLATCHLHGAIVGTDMPPTLVDTVVWFSHRYEPLDALELVLFVTESGAVQVHVESPTYQLKILITLTQLFVVEAKSNTSSAPALGAYDVISLPALISKSILAKVRDGLQHLETTAHVPPTQ